MQIVIKIHEKDYQSMINGHIPFGVLDAIMNGTPLPKHHGRLIDISKYEDSFANVMLSYDDGNQIYTRYTNMIPTIIDAEGE